MPKTREEKLEQIHIDTGMKKEVILDNAVDMYYQELYEP
jgi:hypothetical protein